MRAKINTASQVKPGPSTQLPGTKEMAANGHARHALEVPRKTSLPSGPPIDVEVQLWIEQITDPNKICPCFAHVSPLGEEPDTRLTVAFNLAWWPAAGAVQRCDQNAIKWLGALALVDRILCLRGHPVLKAVGDYLAQLTGCLPEFKRGTSWCAYALKDHELLSPVPGLLLNSKGPAKFAEFEVTVDSAKLDFWRAKMVKRFKRRSLVGAGENAA